MGLLWIKKDNQLFSRGFDRIQNLKKTRHLYIYAQHFSILGP